MQNYLYIISKESFTLKEMDAFQENDAAKIDFFEIDEHINGDGAIITPLLESKINPLLRLIFTNKYGIIIIQLKNSKLNPIHAKSIYNLIKASPYKGEVSIKWM